MNIQLLKLADEHKNVNQFFNMRCQEVDIENSICKFTNEKTGENIEVKSDYILGSDGAYSPVRLKMMNNDRFDYSQSYTKSGHICKESGSIAKLPSGVGVIFNSL